MYIFADLLHKYLLVRLVQSYRFFITLLLLICFSATQFPFELLHNHNNTIACRDYRPGTDVCQHKSHLGAKKEHCLACSIHVEKIFLLVNPLPEGNIAGSSIQPRFILAGTPSATPEHTALRGPPYYIV